MKIKKGLVALFAVIAVLAAAVCFTACGNKNNTGKNNDYVIGVDSSLPLTVEVGDTIDYKQYFVVLTKDGKKIEIADSMLDLSKADTSKEGQFTITLKAGNTDEKLTFTVVDNGGVDIGAVLAKYADSSKRNFAVTLTWSVGGYGTDEFFEYMGENIKYTTQYYSAPRYVGYDVLTKTHYYYNNNDDGSYTKYSEDTAAYSTFYDGLADIDLSELANYEFDENDGTYTAKLPADAGKAVLGTSSTWTSFELTVSGGNVATISAQTSDEYTYEYKFSKFGEVGFTLPDAKLGDDEHDEITADELLDILVQYGEDDWEQNFAAKVTVNGPSADYTDNYEFLGENIKWTFQDESGKTYTDYVGYNASANKYTYYYNEGGGTYTQYNDVDNEDDFWDNYLNMNLVDLSKLWEYEYTAASNGGFAAKTASTIGNAVLGEFEDSTWTSFTIYAMSGNVAKIVATTNDGYTFTYVLSKFGEVGFTLPGTGGTTKPTTPTGTMDKQTYNAATFNTATLQDKLTGPNADPYIGLPSTGTYTALVIPVKFSNTTISDEQLANLNLAFNSTEGETGWESVKSYYQKASYGKLNLSFDIAGYNMGDGVGYYQSSRSSSYYEGLTDTYEGATYTNGDNVLLHEALEYYESRLDLTKYDYNKDGAIDAVYLIYSAPVDYSDDSFYWAYVTWDDDEGKATYDGKDVYYYLFAGLDFMIESVKGGYTSEYYPVIQGLKINASTYIHETGHLFGLDDYYDYFPNQGSDEGLGGADMMDGTVGDQNVYSKMMLGWLTPEIVVSTKTITIQSSQAKGDAILIPLKFDNSYFCEYLLIDLYAKDGLNKMHGNMSGTYLYDGESYGVRIYHVTAWAENPFDNDFGSFTDNNNSKSDIALIKLVEADGETKFVSSDGDASKSDLWQAGDKLSDAFPQYMTNDGKTLIFDITINSVSATQATITITYAA